MDRNDEMKDLISRSKSVFLKQALDALREVAGLRRDYNLDDEFAKTKKNKSPLVGIVIVTFIVLFAIASIMVTGFIRRESRKVTVSIADFADVNLNDVLDSVKKNESDMRNAQRELEDIKRQMDEKIREVNKDTERRIEILMNEGLPADTRDERIKSIRDSAKSDVAGVQREFGRAIKAKTDEISEIQKRVDAYDARMLEQARKQEEIFNNQRRLFDFEMEKVNSYYEDTIKELQNRQKQEVQAMQKHQEELISTLKRRQEEEIRKLILKYNPIFTSGEVKNIIEREIDSDVFKTSPFIKYRETLKGEGVIDNVDFQGMRNQFSDISVLMDKLQETPYINSVPLTLNQIEYLNWLMVRDYEKMWNRLVDVVEDKNTEITELNTLISQQNNQIIQQKKEIDRILYSYDFLTKKNRESGYIIDQRDGENILIYINPIYAPVEGDLGYVFRRDDEYIGTIRFSVSDGTIMASLLELASEKKPLEPFDRILVHIK